MEAEGLHYRNPAPTVFVEAARLPDVTDDRGSGRSDTGVSRARGAGACRGSPAWRGAVPRWRSEAEMSLKIVQALGASGVGPDDGLVVLVGGPS